MEIEEPEADKLFTVKRSVHVPPRHYAVTHISCRNLTEPVTLRPGETLKWDNPSMWVDTYYVDPFKVRVDALTQATANTQVNHTQFSPVPSTSSSDQDVPDDNHPSEQMTSKEGVQVSTFRDQELDFPDVSSLEKKTPVTIPYVIFNLSLALLHPKGSSHSLCR